MRNLTTHEQELLDGYIGDHGETSDGQGNILTKFDNRILENHKVLMHNQLWSIFDERYNTEAPVHKQINGIMGSLPEEEAKSLLNKMNALKSEYEMRKNKIYAATTCEEAHEWAHYPLEMLTNG